MAFRTILIKGYLGPTLQTLNNHLHVYPEYLLTWPSNLVQRTFFNEWSGVSTSPALSRLLSNSWSGFEPCNSPFSRGISKYYNTFLICLFIFHAILQNCMKFHTITLCDSFDNSRMLSTMLHISIKPLFSNVYVVRMFHWVSCYIFLNNIVFLT